MKRFTALILILAMMLSLMGAARSNKKSDYTLTVSKDNISYEISNELYGLFIEDISFAGDGGLSSNLVNNGSFEYPTKNLAAWKIDTVSYSVLSGNGLNKNNKNYLSVAVNGVGTIKNIGYPELYNYKTYELNTKRAKTPDMGFKAGEEYAFSAYFKNVDFDGDISVSLDSKGNKSSYRFTISDCEEWTKITLRMTSDETADGALTITAEGNGIFLMDFVSLVPVGSHGFETEEWKYTTLRTDIYEVLKDLSPKFIRFPGGCFTEGDSLESLYNWKNTIGPLEERKQGYNLWRDDANGKYYTNTNAVGFHEYFTLCDELGATPVPVLSVGLTCQGRNGYGDMATQYKNGAITEEQWLEYVDTVAYTPGTGEWNQYVQDVLDLIEYANGGTDTEWGAKRAENGHPEPFNMKYLALGNENWGDIYWRNFDALYKAVKAQYPDITVVTTAGAGLEGEEFDYAWSTVNSTYRDTVVDEHYYTGDGYLFEHTDRYDTYERSGAGVMIGEYAATCAGFGTLITKNNIWSAIEEAAYLTGVERNADVVKMVSYAPALAKVNAQSWNINLIWFDSQSVVRTPDYYTQMLFANNYGTHYVTTDFDAEEDGIYQSATVDTENQVIYIKLVNSDRKDKTLEIDLSGFENVNNPSVQYMDETFKSACNEFEAQQHVAPVEEELKITDNKLLYTAGGYSVSVIRIPYGDNDGSSLYTLPDMGIIVPYISPAITIAVPSVIGFIALVAGVCILTVRILHHKKQKEYDNNADSK